MRLAIDIGGTHTDAVIITEKGERTRHKVLTTRKDYYEGVNESSIRAIEKLGEEEEEGFQKLKYFLNGTTVTTNIVTELAGARVGLVTTYGFEDTLVIARSPRGKGYDFHQLKPLPELVMPECVVGVKERIDSAGRVVAPLDIGDTKQRLTKLIKERKVETIAICLLWSFRNNEHELKVRNIIREIDPSIPVSLSCELSPRIREYERMVTTTLNAFVTPAVVNYLSALEKGARVHNIKCPLFLMNAKGGFSTISESRQNPINLTGSGPVGGIMGVKYFSELLGIKNALATDVGGTSFDISVLPNRQEQHQIRTKIGPFNTALTTISVDSIGAGGGSIAGVDSRNVLQVGPRSAGANPGPVCYGLGGKEPTVTDALVTLGFINPNRYLYGEVKLSPELAGEAISKVIGEKIGGKVIELASMVYKVVMANMNSRLRINTIEKGYDPRDFTLIAYGGLGPLFCPSLASQLGIQTVIVPPLSSSFSAFGLLCADRVVEKSLTKPWRPPGNVDEVNETFRQLFSSLREIFKAEGYREDHVLYRKEGDFLFTGQFFEFSMPLPLGDMSQKEAEEIPQKFIKWYESIYGAGAAWTSPVQMLNYRVSGFGRIGKPKIKKYTLRPGDGSEAIIDERRVFIPEVMEHRKIPIYDEEVLHAGARFEGPAIIEGADVTTMVPIGATCEKGKYGELKIIL